MAKQENHNSCSTTQAAKTWSFKLEVGDTEADWHEEGNEPASIRSLNIQSHTVSELAMSDQGANAAMHFQA